MFIAYTDIKHMNIFPFFQKQTRCTCKSDYILTVNSQPFIICPIRWPTAFIGHVHFNPF